MKEFRGKADGKEINRLLAAEINKIETTNDTISGRGGLALFMRYVQQTNFYIVIELYLSELKMSKKGLPLFQLVKQMIAFFIEK